ncbi:MAG: FlgD immunoglobulin-like domain containing protein [Candidatus Eisenbacteria bacterium]
MHGSAKTLCACLALGLTLIATAAYSDCDMISILVPNMNTITEIDTLGNQYPEPFDEPSDFWNWFKITQVPRNISGYSVVYYGLNTGRAEKVFEWPSLGHALADWANYEDNQVFRYDIQSTSTTDDAFYWAQQRVWDLDGLDHNAHMVLAHTRWASGGNDDIDDPHPFIWDYPWNGINEPQGENTDETYTYSLEHNGTLTDKQKLRDMTEDLWASWNPGETWADTYPYKTENQGNNELVDSEALFHWIVCNIKLAGDHEEGLRRALIAMKEWDCYKNFIFANSYAMYAYRGYGDLDPDGAHGLVYRVNETPEFYAVSTMKAVDTGLETQAISISNGQAVEFDIRDWVITYDNFDAPQYHTLPYTWCDFEDSHDQSINSSWYLNTHDDDIEYGNIQVVGNEVNRYLELLNTPGQVTQTEAAMYVDLNNEAGNVLEFSFKPCIGAPSMAPGSPGPEVDLDPDGVHFSDDGGETFTFVYEMTGAYAVWQDVELDVDAICLLHGLDLSSTFVVKFVMNDNDPVYNNRIGIDNISIYRDLSGVDDEETGRSGDSIPSTRISILGVAPNPGKASTEVRFASRMSGPIRLEVYDVSGKPVRTLYLGSLGPGSHSTHWDGRDESGTPVGSGCYYMRLRGEGGTSEPVKTILIH